MSDECLFSIPPQPASAAFDIDIALHYSANREPSRRRAPRQGARQCYGRAAQTPRSRADVLRL